MMWSLKFGEVSGEGFWCFRGEVYFDVLDVIM